MTFRAILVVAVALTFGFAVSSCDQANPEGDPVTRGVIVANQGNFSDGNGSVMIIDTDARTVATVGSDLSSIVQSLELRGSVFHVIANTGGRVDIHSTETGQRIGQVTGLASPRYSVTLGTGKTYVTNLYKTGFLGGTVSVIDLSLNEVVKTIDVGNNPEGIVAIGGRIFVANHGFGGGSTLSVISTVTDEVIATLEVGCDGPRTLFVDSEVELWVMCTGQTLFDENFNVIGETPGELVVLDGVTGAETTRFPLSSRILTAGPGQDAYYSAAEQELHVVLDQNKVLRVNTGANALVDTFGPFAGDPIGAVAYDANDELLYLGRVPGFSTNGTVTVHDRAGVQVNLYSVGVAPSHLEFITEEK